MRLTMDSHHSFDLLIERMDRLESKIDRILARSRPPQAPLGNAEPNKRPPCVHRGEQLAMVDCACKTTFKIALYRCALHKQCTHIKASKGSDPCCRTCPDYAAVTAQAAG